ncbi:hypothetical protein ACQP1S_27685 [Micromonospora matsumotoense]|uniref:hypothetical protein n=1 Tax=Micromonospora matsumotoense TaxID=121616 RepID=UPI003D8BB987
MGTHPDRERTRLGAAPEQGAARTPPRRSTATPVRSASATASASRAFATRSRPANSAST